MELVWVRDAGLGFQKSLPGEARAVKVKKHQQAASRVHVPGTRFPWDEKGSRGVASENRSGCDAGREIGGTDARGEEESHGGETGGFWENARGPTPRRLEEATQRQMGMLRGGGG